MPMKVTFELSDRDLRQLRDLVKQASQRSKKISETKIIGAARELVEQMSEQAVPDFVRHRVEQLEALIAMMDDEQWAMAGSDRKRIVSALAYFAEPEDLIPDRIPGLGFLDDAIMVELVVRELRPELDAYADFCKFRKSRPKLLGKSAAPIDREQWLEGRRKQLQSRMRRRRRAAFGARSGPSLKLW